MATYGMLLTTTGAAKLAVALAGGAPVQLAYLAVGDSNGTPYTPTGGETALVHETARVSVESLAQDPQNPPWARVTGVIPAATGGFYIREIGVYDAQGALFAIGRYPNTYKPIVSDGAAFDCPITCILQVGSVASVTVTLDASTVYATRDWVVTHADFFAVLSATTNVPPASPAQGDKYLIPAAPAPIGAWAGKAGFVAIYKDAVSGWLLANPALGAEVRAADTSLPWRRDAAGWRIDMATLAEHLAGISTTLPTNPAGVAAMIQAGSGRRRAVSLNSMM